MLGLGGRMISTLTTRFSSASRTMKRMP